MESGHSRETRGRCRGVSCGGALDAAREQVRVQCASQKKVPVAKRSHSARAAGRVGLDGAYDGGGDDRSLDRPTRLG